MSGSMEKQKLNIAFLGMGGLGLPSYLSLLELLGKKFNLFVFTEYNIKKHRNINFKIIKVAAIDRPKRLREFLYFIMVLWGFIINKFNVIHCHSSFPMGFIGILMGKIFRKKVIISFNGAELTWIEDIAYGFLKYKNSVRITRWVIKNADEVIALSQFHAKELKKNLGFEKEIRVIPRGIDLKKFPYHPKEKSDEIILLCIGYLHPVKNPEMMLEVVDLLSKRIACKLIHIGQDHMNGQILQSAKTKGLADKIEFMGHLPNEELYAYYHKADFLIHTSRIETQGIIFCEAMSCGLACIATQTGLFADLQNFSCKTVEQQDAKAMAEMLIHLHANDVETEKLRKNGRAWIEQNHIEHTVSVYANLYEGFKREKKTKTFLKFSW
jgi:glycosyltransferase involved in cell wall biosynthesis